MRGFFGILFVGLVALVSGAIGYQIGLTSHVVESGSTVVVAGGWGWGWGFGFIFPLLFIGFLFFLFAGRRRAWGSGYGNGGWGGRGGPGGYGPGGPGGPAGFNGSGDPNDPRRQWIANVHRSLHEADAATGTPANPVPAAPVSTPGSTPPTDTTAAR